MSLICLNYQGIRGDEQKIKNLLALWWEYFKDDEYTEVLKAVREHIAESKFQPTIADIKERMKPKLTAFGDNCYDTLAAERLSRGLPERIMR